MVGFTWLHLVLCCFAISTQGIEKLVHNSLVATDDVTNPKVSDFLFRGNNKAFDMSRKINYLTKLYQLENQNSNKLTKSAVTDIRHENSNLASTTTIKTQQTVTDYMKIMINEPKHIKRENEPAENLKLSEYSIQDVDTTVNELSSEGDAFSGGRRIFHGHKTKIKHFPFLVTVHVLGRFVCSGSIIRSNLVITAASCLKRWQEWKIKHPKNVTDANSTTDAITTNESTTDADATTTVPSTDNESKASDFDNSYKTTDKEYETTWAGRALRGSSEAEAEAEEMGTPEIILDEINTPTTVTVADETETPTGTVETTTDWTTTTTEGTTDTTLETSTVWSETAPPKLSELFVRIGTNYYRLGGKVVRVVKVYFHPSYKYENLHNNLAIMRLERHVNVTRRRVKTVDFRRINEDLAVGTNVTIAGWGAKTYHNKVYNALWNLIHKAVLTVSSKEECKKLYTRKFVQPANFCALSEHNEGACNRDAGDPAMLGNELVGVISFGSPKCGAPGSPTVFTNLGYYAAWIDEIIELVQMDDVKLTHKPNNKTKHTTPTQPVNRTVITITKQLTVNSTEQITTDTTDTTETVTATYYTVDNDEKQQEERMDYLNNYYYYPRSYRRYQKSNAIPIATQENKEEEWSKHYFDIILTTKPTKFGTSFRPATTSNIFKLEETDNSSFVLIPISKASYDTIDRPYMNLYHPTKSITEFNYFTPYIYQGKSRDTTLVDSEGTQNEEKHLTNTLFTEDNQVTLNSYKYKKIGDLKTAGTMLRENNGYDVTQPVEYQIPPPQTFTEIKDEMEKIIEQLDLSRVFSSDMKENIITKTNDVLRDNGANKT